MPDGFEKQVKPEELANLLELHEENEFKVRSYRNAYLTLRKLDRPLSELANLQEELVLDLAASHTLSVYMRIRDQFDEASAISASSCGTIDSILKMLREAVLV